MKAEVKRRADLWNLVQQTEIATNEVAGILRSACEIGTLEDASADIQSAVNHLMALQCALAKKGGA